MTENNGGVTITREEAIEVLRRLPIGLMDLSCEQKSDLTEALNIALAALRGPTREQVEVWRTDWKKVDCWNYGELSFDVLRCSECGHNQEIDPEDNRPNFCPDCGRPMTKKGVDIMLKRLEVMKDENRTD